MPAAAIGELAEISAEKRLIRTSRLWGESVRKKKLNQGTGPFDYPSRVHLLYIALNSDAKLTVRHLATDASIDTVASAERALFLEAKSNVENGSPSPNQRSKDFELIEFPKPAFFTIVVDEENWTLYFPAHKKDGQVVKDETHDPIVFIERKTVVLGASDDGTSVTTKTQDFQPNHAFHNATKATIETRDAIRMINFFTDKDGNLLQEPTNYGFEIYVRAPCAGSDNLTTIIIDPDGQNQGPP